MITFLPHIAVPLTIGSVITLCVLTVALVVARLRRDRRERAQADRRRAIAKALERGDADTLLYVTGEAVTAYDVRADLADVLRRHDAAYAAVQAPHALVLSAIADTRSRSPVRRALGAEIVAQLGRTEDLVHTAHVLHHDSDRQARRVAARALSRRGEEASARHLLDGLIHGSLPADRLVEQLGHGFAVPTLIGALEWPHAAHARGDIVAALGLARHRDALPVVAAFVRDGNRHERLRACRALGRLGCAEAVPLLIFAMGDSSHTVRAMAARSLGELGDPRCARVLELSLSDSNWWVRANAASALAELGYEGIAALRRALHSGDRFARDRAAEALAMHDAAQERAAA